MNSKATHTVHIKNEDGSVALFPVSPNVVSLRTVPAAKKEVTPVRLVSRRARMGTAVFSLFLMTFTLGGSPLFVGATLSYFRDDEVSRNNIFAAASLAFNLNPGEVTEEISLDESVFLAPKFTPDDATLPIMYRVSAEIVGEPTPLCSQLMANGTTSPFFYTGQLTSLITEPATTTGHGLLEVSLASADGIAAGAQCTVDIVYRGWHQDSLENSGYTDEERDRFTFVYVAPEAEVAPDIVPEPTVTEESVSESEEMPPPAEENPAPVPEPTPAPEPTQEPEQTPVPIVENFSPSGGNSTEPSEPVNDPIPEDGAPEGDDTSSDTENPAPPPETAPENSPAETPPAEAPPVDVPTPEASPATE